MYQFSANFGLKPIGTKNNVNLYVTTQRNLKSSDSEYLKPSK